MKSKVLSGVVIIIFFLALRGSLHEGGDFREGVVVFLASLFIAGGVLAFCVLISKWLIK